MAEVRALVEKVSPDMPEGPWQVLHACLSVAIDDFVRVVDQMQDDVEDVEELLLTLPEIRAELALAGLMSSRV